MWKEFTSTMCGKRELVHAKIHILALAKLEGSQSCDCVACTAATRRACILKKNIYQNIDKRSEIGVYMSTVRARTTK